MSAIIFNGREAAKKKKEELRKRIAGLGVTPKLVSFYLPSDEGSALYTRIKKKSAEEVGMEFEDIEIENNEDRIEEVVARIKQLNEDQNIHGILVQKPSGINNFNERDWIRMISEIREEKDVDGLRPGNLNLIRDGKKCFLPATVKAVLSVIEFAEVTLPKCDIAIVGDTDILGKPLAAFLLGRGAKVTVANKETKDLKAATQNADVLVSATGVADLIRKDMVKEGAIVIDVGEPKGDVADSVREVAGFLSPVPGGVGPLTVVSLLENTIEAASIGNSS